MRAVSRVPMFATSTSSRPCSRSRSRRARPRASSGLEAPRGRTRSGARPSSGSASRGRGRDRARRQVREAARRVPLGARGAEARGRSPRLPVRALGRRREHVLEEPRASSQGVDGVLVPGGFGSRGWEGKILACRVARERSIPYLGICLGMHVAVSEFARHVPARRRELDRDGSGDAVSGDRPAPRAEGGRGSRRHDAPRCAGGGARRRDAPRRRTRTRSCRSDTGTGTRSTTRTAALVDAGLVVRGRSRRVASSSRRAAGSSLVRRESVPPGVQVAPDAPAPPSVSSSAPPWTGPRPLRASSVGGPARPDVDEHPADSGLRGAEVHLDLGPKAAPQRRVRDRDALPRRADHRRRDARLHRDVLARRLS